MMIPEALQRTYTALVEDARAASDAYYNDPENSVLPDDQFDALVDDIAKIEAMYPSIISPLSPTQVVGGAAGSTRHDHPMLSLHKETDLDKAVEMAKDLQANVLVQMKLDGVSMSLEYRDGELVQALTRGDGEAGEPVTETMRLLPSVPEYLDNNFTGFVRGEVVIHKDELPEGLANARNGAAGSINHKDPKVAAQRNCRFYAFDVLGGDYDRTSTALAHLKQLGFTLAPTIMLPRDTGRVVYANRINEVLAHRSSLPYLTDGIVVKADEYEARDRLGTRSNSPKWAFAVKVPAPPFYSVVRDLEVAVGKSGQLGLRYVVDEVDSGLSKVTRATAHNMSEVRRLDVRRGDRVTMRLMGEVIPGIVCVTDPSQRTGEEEVFEAPTQCPSCGSAVEEFGTKMQLRCTGEECSGNLTRRISHWASKPAANIEALGPKWIEKLVDAGLVTSVTDLYRLNRLQLMRLEGMGDTLATKLLASIENSKQLGMRRAFIGLSVPGAGEGTAERLCKKFENLQHVVEAKLVDLMAADLGPVSATKVKEFFSRPSTLDTLMGLSTHGVDLSRRAEDAPLKLSEDAAFSGKKVCVTGSLSCGREDFHKLLQTHGGAIIAKSVSSKTDYLVVGANVGKNKTDAAKKHGVEVITEETARKAMGLS